MIRILMVCHGNICRSPMAEFVFRHMVKERGMGDKFHIASCATSTEEIGNPVHQGTREKLRQHGISTEGKYAVQLRKKDYDNYDYLLGMDTWNIRNILRIVKSDPENKVHRLLDFSKEPRDIADPWYTGNFDVTYNDIVEGCQAFLNYLKEHRREQF
ncbi:MAG: low molecular weight protein-tyrosine-phosphatase [Lachnoclostridium edouardi]|uniref:low molecular weight protein-tyrosine-phosphatase n=1 Tax=Lachnoclostridium edouardi TaxID=1926283 RepID=UPI0026DB05A6|nr:low molecular weight protein-tyrosine-phosphatase [Lachnoclostridium edouardi]MDO4278966.1 low molecular weight protein-tyrosine-phosphatase [Lachnoclostridium edouardi]